VLLLILPIGDENPREGKPYGTWGLIFLLTCFGLLLLRQAAPAPEGVGAFLFGPFCPSTFVDWGIGVLFLWVFADNVEDRFGTAVFLPLYLLWGWIGLGAARLALPEGSGACGALYAVSAVVGAYVTLFPRHYVLFLNLFPLLFSVGRSRVWDAVLGIERPEANTHYVRAYWAALLWIAFAAGLVAFDPRLSFAGALVAGLAGAASAWLARVAFGVRVSEPTTPDALLPTPLPARSRVRDAAGTAPAGSTAVRAAGKAVAPEPAHAPGPRPAPQDGESFLEVAEERAEPAPAPESPADGRTGFAVIRLTEELADVSVLGRIVAQNTGEYFADVTRRVRVTRGLLARQVPAETAQKIVEEMQGQGLAAAAVDLGKTPALPEVQLIAGAGVSPQGCEFQLREGGARVSVPWNRIGLVAAGQIESRRSAPAPYVPDGPGSISVPTESVERQQVDTLIDFVLRNPRARLRLYREDANFTLMTPEENSAGELGFKRFVRGLVQHRGATPVNTGVKVLDRGGKWGYLRFRAERDFDDYCWWLSQLLAWRKTQADQGTSFLE